MFIVCDFFIGVVVVGVMVCVLFWILELIVVLMLIRFLGSICILVKCCLLIV